MYLKFDAERKKVKKIKLKSDSTTIPTFRKTETGLQEQYKSYSDSPNYDQLCSFLSADTYIPSDIVCGNEEHII